MISSISGALLPKAALTALLFVYAKLNPGVRYVQGRWQESMELGPWGMALRNTEDTAKP